MSIDNYAVEGIDEILDEIEGYADDNPEIKDAVNRARDYLSYIENSDDEEIEPDPDDLPSSDLEAFKIRVIDAIPYDASLKFGMDVEEMLEKFKFVY